MPAIEVHPEVLARAGQVLSEQGDALAGALGALDGALRAGEAMCGHDTAGVVFGEGYTRQGQALLSAAAAGVNACRQLGFGVSVSASNYAAADAASTPGGGATGLPCPGEPAKFSAPVMPEPLGSGVAAPALWFLVEHYVGDFWPDGKPGQCRAAASAWAEFGNACGGVAAEVHAAGPAVGAHHIPEGPDISRHLAQASEALTGLAAQCRATATQLDAFAAQVEATQNAIRDLLHRLSPAGILADLSSLHFHNPLDDIMAVARDIEAVLAYMKRAAQAAEAMLHAAMAELHSATTAFESWAIKEFVHFAGGDTLPYFVPDRARELASRSPTLQNEWQTLKAQGWVFELNPGQGSGTYYGTKTIDIGPNVWNGDPRELIDVVAHEMGHAMYGDPAPDMTSRASCIQSKLDSEGAAVLNQIKVDREIDANGGGFTIPVDPLEYKFENVYDAYLKAGSTKEAYQAAITAIGKDYGPLHPSLDPASTYNDDYGEGCPAK